MVLTAAIALLLAAPAAAQEKPEYDMGLTQMVLLMRIPDAEVSSDDSLRVMKAQRAYIDTLIARGEIRLSGIGAPDDSLVELLVIKADSLGAGPAFGRNLPSVQMGLTTPRYLSWYVARNYMKPAAKPLNRIHYIFGILVRGPKWTPEVTEESKKIQEAHLANIGRLSDMGKLVIAGPFEGNLKERGVFIFKVPTVWEAEELTDTDPAVRAGRLAIELHPVDVPIGMLR